MSPRHWVGVMATKKHGTIAEVVRREVQVWSAKEWQLAAAQHLAEQKNGKDGIGVDTDITVKDHAHRWLSHHMFQGNVY